MKDWKNILLASSKTPVWTSLESMIDFRTYSVYKPHRHKVDTSFNATFKRPLKLHLGQYWRQTHAFLHANTHKPHWFLLLMRHFEHNGVTVQRKNTFTWKGLATGSTPSMIKLHYCLGSKGRGHSVSLLCKRMAHVPQSYYILMISLLSCTPSMNNDIHTQLIRGIMFQISDVIHTCA